MVAAAAAKSAGTTGNSIRNYLEEARRL